MAASIHRPRLNFAQLWNMSFGFFGIQFGFALQNANMTRIFQTLDPTINMDEVGWLWAAAPATGLLVQPVIGYLSDRTWHARWGRRRPFFFIGALLAAVALFIMPNSPALWFAAVMLWVLDASINISMEPFRAFVGDKLPENQRTHGFAFQTFFIGMGAVIASMLPFIFTNVFQVSNTAPVGEIPDAVKYSFYVGGLVFFIAVLWTVLTSKEIPPQDIQKWKEEKERTKGFGKGFKEIIGGIRTMPKTMMQLAFVQFFTWLAFFAMWFNTTPAVAANVYNATDKSSKSYQDAGDWVGVMFMVYNGVAALAAFLLPVLALKIGKKHTHLLSLVVGGLGLFSIFFIHDNKLLILPMIAVGIAWASTLTMPYSILGGTIPPNRMGYYMGVFNFTIVVPQLVAAAILGSILKQFFNDEAIYGMIIGGISMVIAGLLNLFVQTDTDDSAREIVEEIMSTKDTPTTYS